MLNRVEKLAYVIVLCEDIERMKAFYRDLFAFPVESESPTSLAFRVGSVFLALRKRTRIYDGRGSIGSPGVQIAFLMTPAEVDLCHKELLDKGVTILDPPKDQPWGHRTLYFSDPESNILEIYADI